MAKRQINQRVTADIVPMPMDDDSDDNEPQEVFQVPLLKRKLLADFGRPSTIEPPVSEHMKVYLRIRPFTEDEINKGEDQKCLNVDTSQTVTTKAPKESHYFKNTARGFGRTTHKYTFSHIFNDDTSQKEFFNETMLGLVKDFIDGQNCLVFSYGVTNSGKTYTIQGNAKDGGVLPRALDVLFNSISGQQWDGMNIKPDLFMNVTRLTPDQELMERKVKERIMKLSCEDDLDVMSLLGDDMSDISVATNTTTCSESSNISTMDPKDSLDNDERLLEEISNREREDAKVSVDKQGAIKFSVWVSFAEIYNEQIYDLLEPISKKKNAKRPCLKLSDDHNGSPYIKGLKYVHVNSADEAYKLMTIGQRNLKTACTKLNHNSSRSHCIFNIKILRVIDKDDPHVARVSMLSLCDLAGSERYSKSQTSGERLKEAGNINTSLLTLGRCIETLRHNQGHKSNTRLVPFRESKLTRLFQNFFSGRGKAIMFVNVNQCSSMFDETQHVFKFSAIASQVVVQQKPIFIKPKLPVPPSPNPLPKVSISWATPAKTKQAEQRQVENIPLPEESDDDIEEEETRIYTQEHIDELVAVAEQLQKELAMEIKLKETIESKIRKEVCEEMMTQFADIEERCSERIREREQTKDEYAEKRMQLLIETEQKKKKKEQQKQMMTDEEDEWVSSILLHQETLKVQKRDETIGELKTELENYKQKIQNMEKEQLKKQDETIGELKTEIENYKEKIQNMKKELQKKSDEQAVESNNADVIENLTQQLQQTRQHIKEQETEIKELNDMLTEAGETFQQTQKEISSLKELNQDFEKKIEQQAEAISVLERAATDSRVAIDTADQSLTKREESVAELQLQIRNLEGDVNKYRNKSRFFESQLVEREEEAAQYKQKLETAQREHAKSQEALIHGFTAEIGNYKSQLFKLKAQLCRSPTKSPGGSLMSPLGMLRSPSSSVKSPIAVVEISPLLSSSAEKSEKVSQIVKSAAKCLRFDNKTNDNDLKSQMDTSSDKVFELQQALDIAKSSIEEMKKNKENECSKNTEAKNKIAELQEVITAMQKDDDEQREKNVAEILESKNKELDKANEKIKELEPCMKDYFSKSKQVTKLMTSEKKLKKELQENKERNNELNITLNELKTETERKEKQIEALDQRLEELELLNKELKDMLNRTTNDLEVKHVELKALSPVSSKVAQKNHILIQTEDEDFNSPIIIEKDKEIYKLSSKVSKLTEGIKARELSYNETKEKCKELEFRIDEKEIESEDLKVELEGKSHKVENLQGVLENNQKELTNTGEELAVASREVSNLKRIIAELQAEMEVLKEKKGDNMIESSAEIKCRKVDDLNEKLRQTEFDRAKVSENLAILEKKHSELSSNAEKMKSEVSRLESVLVSKDMLLGELSEKIERVTNEKELFENQCKIQNDSQNEVEKLRTLLSEKNEEIELFTQNLNSVLEEKERDELVETKAVRNLSDIKDKLASKDLRLSQYEREIAEANHRIQELETEQVQLQHQITVHKTTIAHLNTDIQSLHALEENMTEKENYIMNLKSQIEVLESELTEVHQHKRDSGSIDHQCGYKDSVDTIKEEMKKVLKENDCLKLKNVECEKTVLELREDLKWKASEMESLETELKSVRELLKVTVEKNSHNKDTDNESEMETRKPNNEHQNENKENVEEQLSDAFVEIAKLKSSEHTQKALQQKVKGELEEALLEIENNRSELERLREKATEIKHLENLVETLNVKLEKSVQEEKSDKESSPNKNINKDLEKIEKLERFIEKLEKQLSISTEKVALHDKINADLREEYDSRLKRKEKEQQEAEEKLCSTQSALEGIQKEKQDLKDFIQKVQDELKRKCDEKDSQEAQIKSLQEQLYETVERQETLAAELEEKTRENEAIKESFSNRKEQSEEVDERLSDALNEIAKYKSAEHTLKALNHKLKGELQEALLNAENYTSEMERLTSKVEKLEKLNKLNEAKSLTEAGETIDELKQELENSVSELKLKEEELEKLSKTRDSEVSKAEETIKELRCNLEEQEKLTNAKSSAAAESEDKIIELKQKIDKLESEKGCVKEAETVTEPLLQVKLNSVISKLNKAEIRNRSLLKEVNQLESCVDRLKQELQEARQAEVTTENETPRRSRSSIMMLDARQSISSPSTKIELEKSKERERHLSQELKKASGTMQEWLVKFNEAEVKLQEKSQELNQARTTIDNLKADKSKLSRTVEDLNYQLQTETRLLKENITADSDGNEQIIASLKETLKDQEAIMDQQDELLESKDKELRECEADYKELQKKYNTYLESTSSSQHELSKEKKEVERIEAERDLVKQQLADANLKLELIETEVEDVKGVLKSTEKKLSKAVEEKEKLGRVVKENNKELKEMEKSLTEARRQCEELKEQEDPSAENRLMEARREWEKKETGLINDLQKFREERDKLVSGLEVVLKKKDNEIKKHKDVIKQLKEKEIAITKSWHEERQRIADGLQDLNHHTFAVKQEQTDENSHSISQHKLDGTQNEIEPDRSLPLKSSTRPRSSKKPPPRPSPPTINYIAEEKDNTCDETDNVKKSPAKSPMRAYSCNITIHPPSSKRLNFQEDEETEILQLSSSPGSPRKSSSKLQPISSTKRGTTRKGKKRNSPANEENLPPAPKRRSLDQAVNATISSETSEDYSTHLQIDATPTVAAKTLRKTRKRNGSKLDLSTQQSPERKTRSLRSKSLRVKSKEVLQTVTETVTRTLRSRQKSPAPT